MLIVAGVVGRLPGRPLGDMMATVELLEGVGETLLEPGRIAFGGELARIKLGVLFCAENNDGFRAKDVVDCDIWGCMGGFDGVGDDRNASKSSSSNRVLECEELGSLLSGCAPFGGLELNSGMLSLEYLLSIGAEIMEAAMRLSLILSSSDSIICASSRASKSFEEICPRFSKELSLFLGLESIMPCREGVGVDIIDDPTPTAWPG